MYETFSSSDAPSPYNLLQSGGFTIVQVGSTASGDLLPALSFYPRKGLVTRYKWLLEIKHSLCNWVDNLAVFEVSRSCVYMSYRGKNILVDCEIHSGYSEMAVWLYFDEINSSTIDVLLTMHFHLNLAASFPYFLEKTIFKGYAT